MNVRVPVYIQPISNEIKYLPTNFNSNEYDTLSSLNLPMNSDGSVAPGACARIPLGYRIILPRGCVGMMKERRSIVEQTPFHVLAGMLDCNAMREDIESEFKINLPQDMSEDGVGTKEVTKVLRMHPEIILYIHNCGTIPLEYTKGKSLVQLFIVPICESQIQLLPHDKMDPITIPLRYAGPQVQSHS